MPEYEALKMIADYFKVSPLTLLGWENDEINTFEGGENMTASEKKQLLNALEIIREECGKHKGETCAECPLCTDRGCNLNTPPRDWHFVTEKEAIWRAFIK